MPSATTVSFEEELLSDRLLAFMNNGDHNSISNSRGSSNGINMIGLPNSAQKTLTLDKNGAFAPSNKNHSFVSISCNSPTHQMSSSSAFGMSSPGVLNKYTPVALGNPFFHSNSTRIMEEYHSLQNSPFYNHYPTSNGFYPLKRQNGSNGGSLLLSCPPNGGIQRDIGNINTGSMDYTSIPSRQPPQRELFPQLNLSRCETGWPGALSHLNQNSGLLMQDRLHYDAIAQNHGFIVGLELDRIKENSRRSTSHTYGRISAHFRNRYGETEARTKAAYMQLGVRVPSKDHVSEIVGKGGQKIKLIREETGALITTPGEYEDHVFIIEAPPEMALRVATLIATRAQEITQSKLSASERRRESTSSISGNNNLFNCCSINGLCGNSVSSNGVQASSSCISSGFINNHKNGNGIRNSDDSTLISSPLPLVKGSSSPRSIVLNSTQNLIQVSSCSEGSAFTGSNGVPISNNANNFSITSNINVPIQHSLASGGTSAAGRVLLARSKIAVPQDMVGKIIGTQGSIITTIQKDTGTEIKSPPKEAARGPAATSEFEISAYQSLGMTSNQAAECRVQQAKQLIGHLVMRQFERRASEDSEDHSSSASTGGRKISAGTDDSPDQIQQSSGQNGGLISTRFAWMWPDVTQMGPTEAREVLDRILAESKSKTRRAKELAAVSVPPSPGGSGLPSGFNGIDLFSEKNHPISASVGTTCVSISCHNSPFPQSPSIRSMQQQTQPQALNLLNGCISDHRNSVPISGCDFIDTLVDHQQHQLHHQAFFNSQVVSGTSGVPGVVCQQPSGGTSNYWQNTNQSDGGPMRMPVQLRQSFTTVRNQEETNLSQSSVGEFGLNNLDRVNVNDLFISRLTDGLAKERKSSTDWLIPSASDIMNFNMKGDVATCLSDSNSANQTFDFIPNLDGLYLESNELVKNSREILYPPGFDGDTSDSGLCAPSLHQWSTKNDIIESPILNGIFSKHGSNGCANGEGKSSSDFSDSSTGGDRLQVNDSVRNIWSDNLITETNHNTLFPGLPYSSVNFGTLNTNTDFNNNSNTSNRCGAVGDGRRRATPPRVGPSASLFSPVANSNVLNDSLATASIQAV